MRLLYPYRGRKLKLLVQFGSAMALTLFGISGIISTPAFQNSINFTGNVPLPTFIVAGILLGDVVGCILVVPFAYRIGRRLCIICACWIGLIGVVLQTSTFSAVQMIIGRILLGIGNGTISAIVPAFVQESAVGNESGKFQDILVTVGYGVVGIAAANWVDYGIDLNAWRTPIAIQAFFLVAALIVFHGVMESPRWLYAKHREAKGDESLCRLLDLPINDEVLQTQKQEILASVRLDEVDAEDSLTILHLFRDKSQIQVAERIWLLWAIALGAPLFGNVIVFYSSSISTALGLSLETTQLLTASLQSAAPVGMLSAFCFLPRFGRRPLLIFGGAWQLTMMILFTIFSNLGPQKTTNTTQWIAVAALFIYQTICCATWIRLPYLYGVEIIPTRYRGQVNANGNATFWGLAFIEVYAAPIALDHATGAKFFIWFCLGGACVLGGVFCLAKETRGLSLEEIDVLWASDEFRALSQEVRVIEGGGVLVEKEGSGLVREMIG